MYFSDLFIGVVRGSGFIHSPLLENPGRVSKDLIHVTDWLQTILSLAGVKIPENILDGYDQWSTLQNEEASPREEILLNIDDKALRNSALIKNGWKIVSEGNAFPKHMYLFIISHVWNWSICFSRSELDHLKIFRLMFSVGFQRKFFC